MESTQTGGRIRQLDVLAGLAVLGILVTNVTRLAGPTVESVPSFPSASSQEAWTWGLTTLLFEDNMLALLSLVFGAGVGLLALRGVVRPVWRNVLLFGIGAAHAYGLWHGDILMVFAACGLALVFLKQMPVALLLILGTLCVLQPVFEEMEAPVLYTLSGELPELSGFEQRRLDAYSSLLVDQEERAHTEMSYGEQARWRAELIRWHQFGETRNPFRCGGFMLIGLALFRLGFLTGAARRRTYATVTGVALPLGLVLTAVGMQPELQAALGRSTLWETLDGLGGPVWVLRYIGAGITALGSAALVLWLCRSELVLRAAIPLAAVGRMALTCYLAQTVVCVLIYEGWAGGAWGSQTHLRQLTFVAWMWVAQLVLCPFWLAYFRHGPVEWLWRSSTRLRPLPMRVGSDA